MHDDADLASVFGRPHFPFNVGQCVREVGQCERALFEAAILYLAGKELINSAIELSLERETVKCIEYPLPKG